MGDFSISGKAFYLALAFLLRPAGVTLPFAGQPFQTKTISVRQTQRSTPLQTGKRDRASINSITASPLTTKTPTVKALIVITNPFVPNRGMLDERIPSPMNTRPVSLERISSAPLTTTSSGSRSELVIAECVKGPHEYIRAASVPIPTRPTIAGLRTASLPSLTQTRSAVPQVLAASEGGSLQPPATSSTRLPVSGSPRDMNLIASLPSRTDWRLNDNRIVIADPARKNREKVEAPRLLAKAPRKSSTHLKQKPSYTVYRSRRITVQIGMFASILSRGIKSVAIADPSIADVVVLSTATVLVNGKTRGVTNLVLWDASGMRTYEVRVVDRLKVTPQEVEAAIGLPKVRVRLIGDAVVLDGDVDNQEQAARAKAIAGLYADKIVDLTTTKSGASTERPVVAKQVQEAIDIPGVQARVVGESVILKGVVQNETQKQQAERVASLYGSQVVSFIEVQKPPPPPPPSLAEIRSMIGMPTVQLREIHDRLILEGEAPSDADKARAESIAKLSGKVVDNRIHTPEEKLANATARAKQVQDAIGIQGVTVQAAEDKLILKGVVPTKSEVDRAVQLAKMYSNDVVSLLETPRQQQVRIELKIVEISLDKTKDLGFDVNPATGQYGDFTGTLNFGGGNAGSTSIGSLGAKLLALQRSNQAKILSSPSATVLSGKKVDFKVGGQIPLPVSNFGTSGTQGGVLTQSVEFHDFGILMTVEPTVQGDKDVTMKLKTEVSQPDFSNAVVINGSRIPGFKNKQSQTEVMVKDGQTLVIGGLIDHQITKNVTSMPILGDIPILGELVKSRRFQRSETELVIFVTPRVSVVSGG